MQVFLLIAFIMLMTIQSHAFDLRLELGETQVHSNYFRVPKSATRVSFPDNERIFTGRIYASWKLDSENSLRLLIAPFSARATITPTSNILFRDATFNSGTPVDIDYKFNSYRLSYIRQWKTEEAFRPYFGLTAKIRDAEIKLTNSSTSAKRANVGFVPLLNLGFDYVFNPIWLFNFDLDAAAASQGRALDGALELRYSGLELATVGGGLRVLDGGVNTESNENFAQLRTWFLSLSKSF